MRTQAEQLLGVRVTGSDGKVIGTVEQVFRDDVDGTPAWARVRSGRTGRFVPLGTSQVTADGLSVPFDSPKVMNCPDIEAGQHMSAAQCEELSRYYGLVIPAQQAPREQPPGQQAPSPVPAQEVPSQQGAEQLIGAQVTGSDGKVIGTVEQVFRDDVDKTPAWAQVRSGRLVPLGASQVTAEGLRVPFDSPTVMNSPDIGAGQHISAAQAEELSRYYGLTIPGQQAPSQQAPSQQVPAQEVPSQQGAEQLLGARVTGSDGKVIGTVEQVFWDDVDGTPAWARIRSGNTGRFVPLGTSQATREGVRVPFDSLSVMNSPDIEAGQHMSAAQAEELRRYYGLSIRAQQAPGQQAPSQQIPPQQG
jgi:sporulation protein YlmC with PRC-barrel domain